VTLDWTLHDDPQSATALVGATPEPIVMLGDRVVLKTALAELTSPLPETVDVRPLCAEGACASGIARMRSETARALGPAAFSDDLRSLPGGARAESLVVPRGWAPLKGDDPAQLATAETLLIKSLTKKADGIIARNINRKISGRLTRVFAPHGVHPNMVTAVVALIGIMSGPFCAMGTYRGFVLGGLCYYLAAVLDGVDGELSRLKFLASPLGAWLDTITDDVVGTSYLIGLYYGLNKAAPHSWWGWIGLAAVVFYFLTIFPRYWLLITSVGAGDHQVIAAQRLAEEKGAFGRAVDAVASTIFRLDFLTFMSFVLALLSAPWIYAGGFAIGSVMSFIETIYTVRQVRAAHAPSG
jgi:phosphatidylglycerophosphate synthase